MTATSHEVDRIHGKIITLLESQTPELNVQRRAIQLATRDHIYSISNAACRGILKCVAPEVNQLPYPNQLELLNSLASGQSHEEKIMVGMLLHMRTSMRARLRPAMLRRWLNQFTGWAQVDSLCQNVFGVDEILTDWSGWHSFIESLAASDDVRERRASLVLLVGPVRWTRDERLVAQACDSLHQALDCEDPMVTKAVSWLLREMSRMYRGEVERFVRVNESELPRSTVREVAMGLEVGSD